MAEPNTLKAAVDAWIAKSTRHQVPASNVANGGNNSTGKQGYQSGYGTVKPVTLKRELGTIHGKGSADNQTDSMKETQMPAAPKLPTKADDEGKGGLPKGLPKGLSEAFRIQLARRAGNKFAKNTGTAPGWEGTDGLRMGKQARLQGS